MEEYSDKHRALKTFVKSRSQSPQGQETTQLPKSKQVVYNLHAWRYRGLTWFDEEDDVCWLIGVGFHEFGSRSDAYVVLKERDKAGELLPTEEDYRSLYQWRRTLGASALDDLIHLVAKEGPNMLSAALAAPGSRVGRILGDALEVDLVVEESLDDDHILLREYSVTFVMPPVKPGVLPSGKNWQLLLIFAFLPETADVSELEWRTSPRGDVVVFRELEDTSP